MFYILYFNGKTQSQIHSGQNWHSQPASIFSSVLYIKDREPNAQWHTIVACVRGCGGISDLVISPWCWPVGLESAKPNKEEKEKHKNGQRGGRDAASSGCTYHSYPAPERQEGKRSAGVCRIGSALAGDSTVQQNNKEKGRGGGEKWTSFALGWIDIQSHTKLIFLPFWFYAVMPLASMELLLIHGGVKGGFRPMMC